MSYLKSITASIAVTLVSLPSFIIALIVSTPNTIDISFACSSTTLYTVLGAVYLTAALSYVIISVWLISEHRSKQEPLRVGKYLLIGLALPVVLFIVASSLEGTMKQYSNCSTDTGGHYR